MGGDDVSPDILRDRRLNTDPVSVYIAGKDRVSLKKTLGVGWKYIETVDRAMDERGSPDLYNQAREEMKQVSLEAGNLGLRDVAVKVAREALGTVSKGSEGRGEEISKVLVKAAFNAEADTQELLDKLVADGKLAGEQADRVSGWVGAELLRLAAHAKESSRLGGPRQEVMDAIYPVSGQINSENWNSGTWAAHVEAARETLVSESVEENAGRGEQEAFAGAKKEGFVEKAARVAENFFKDPKSLGWLVFVGDEILEGVPPLIKAYTEKYKAKIAADAASQLEAEARRKARAAGYLDGTIPPPLPREQAVVTPAEKGPTTPVITSEKTIPTKRPGDTEEAEPRNPKKTEGKPVRREPREATEAERKNYFEKMLHEAIRSGDGRAKAYTVKRLADMAENEITPGGTCMQCGAGRELGEICPNCNSGSLFAGFTKYIEGSPLFIRMFGDGGTVVRTGGGGVARGVESPRGAENRSEVRPGEGIPGPESQERLVATVDFFNERDFEAWGLNTQTLVQKRGERPRMVSAVDLLNQYALSPRGLADKSEQMGLMAVLSEKDRTTPNFTNGLINLIELRRAHNGYLENYDGLSGHQRITDGLSVKNMAELISTNEQSMRAMTLALQLARARIKLDKNDKLVEPEFKDSLANEIFKKYEDIWMVAEKARQPEINQKMAEMKAEIAKKLDISLGAADIAVTYAQAWGGRMGFTEMSEMAKKFPPFADAGYTGSFLDRVEVVLDGQGITLGSAWDGWIDSGMTPEEATAAMMRVLREGGAPVNSLTQSWNYLGSAKEVLDEMERTYSGKQHKTWGAEERDAVVYGDGKSGGLIDKWNGKWKYTQQVLGKSIDYCRKTQIVGASMPVREATRPGLGGIFQSTKEYKEHTPGWTEMWNSWKKLFSGKK